MSSPSLMNVMSTRFPDIYKLLLDSKDNPNPFIFFQPDPMFYTKESIEQKNFYYAHIFQRSKYNESLFVNLLGRVIRTENMKTFIPYLCWFDKETKENNSNEMEQKTTKDFQDLRINVKENITDVNGITYFQTDSICIEELCKIKSIKGEPKKITEIKRFSNMEEYLNYYNNDFGKEDQKFMSARKCVDAFIYSMKNTYILVKGQEIMYSKIFKEKTEKLISIFLSVIKQNQKLGKSKEEAVKEMVECFIFDKLYDPIMNQIQRFNYLEEIKLAKKLKENINKYDYQILMLPDSIKRCTFKEPLMNLGLLNNFHTSFEKRNHLCKIYEQMLSELSHEYELDTCKKLEEQGDLRLCIWLYLIAKAITLYNVPHLISEKVFLSNFSFVNQYNEKYSIMVSFMSAIESMQIELLNKDPDLELAKQNQMIVITTEK